MSVDLARETYDRLAEAGLFGYTLGALAGTLLLGTGGALWRARRRLRPGFTTLSFLALVGVLAWVARMEPPAERTHLVQYALVACFAYLSMPGAGRLGEEPRRRPHELLRHLAALGIVALVGFVDETVQELVPRRGFALRDVGLDVIGGALALVVFALFRRSVRPAED